ncbi:MAG: chemotaxis protein CheA [Fibrobacterota bacterium]
MDVDIDVLLGFIDEALDDLDSVSERIVSLEEEGFNEELIQGVFRVYHSIKGNASYFGLFKIKDLAHMLEQILDKLRKRDLVLTADVTEALLKGTAQLQSLFNGVRSSGGAEPGESVDAVISDIQAVIETPSSLIHLITKELQRIDSKYHIDEIGDLLSYISNADEQRDERETDKAGGTITEIDEVLAVFSEHADREGPLEDSITEGIGASLKRLFEAYKWTEDGKDLLDSLYDDYSVCRSTVGLDPLMREILEEKLDKLNDPSMLLKDQGKTEKKEASSREVSAGRSSAAAKTMRVKESTVDDFLSFVGELVIVEEMYGNFQNQVMNHSVSRSDLLSRHKKITENFQMFSRMLQKSIMDIRKVSIGKLLKRMPTIVREISGKLEKDITTELVNTDIEVDKTLLERLDAPLVHMVRNAADHGIEPPADRVSAGKPPKGTIRITAREERDSLILEITDDGAGINTDKIRAKAFEMGLIKEQDTLTKDDILNVMFSSGVSTAEEVTDISGRGVGMDVVKDSIEKSGGSIEVSTEPGRGSQFSISLPSSVTTQIIKGLVLEVGNERYIVPVSAVVASMVTADANIRRYKEGNRMMAYGDEMLPVYLLSQILHTKDDGGEYTVIVERGSKARIALIADGILGIQQIVLKDIGDAHQPDFIAGGAVMGDERVALILDVDMLNGEA